MPTKQPRKNLKVARNAKQPSLSPIVQSLGDIDAYRDGFLRHCFVDMDFVTEFRQPEKYFLVGRRGSGKTATVLRLFEDDPGPKTLVSWNRGGQSEAEGLDFLKLFVDLLVDIREHTYRPLWEQVRLSTVLHGIWQHLIQVAAMNQALQSGASLPLVEQLLKSRGYTGRSPFIVYKRLLKGLAGYSALDSRAEQIRFIVDTLDAELSGKDVKPARKEFERWLDHRDQPFTVYVDALIDRVTNEDKFIIEMVLSLMNAIYDLLPYTDKNPLRIKASIPGEVFERLTYFDLQKLHNRCVFPHWTRKDLRRMLDERLRWLLKKQRRKLSGEPWETFFPRTVTNKMGHEEAAFYYLCRHSQHYPREILLAVNALLTRGSRIWAPKDFTAAVERACHDMVGEFFQRTRASFGELAHIVELLHGADRVLSHDDLSQRLRDEGKRGREVDEWIDRLKDAGVLGVVANFNSPTDLTYKAQFSFITRHRPISNRKSIFAIHPMFYERLQIKRHGNRYVYPEAYLDDELKG